MVEFIDGKVNVQKLEVTDIISVDVLQNFLDNFALGMNCAAVSVDREGREITKPSYYREYCKNYIHKTALGDKRCAECHNNMGKEALKINKPYVGRCHAGLIDFAVPIKVHGEHIGTVLGGQVLHEQPEELKVKEVALELGIQEESLWEAAKNIDIVDKINVDSAAQVLDIVVNALAENGYNRLEIDYLSKNLAENFMQISKTIEILAESAQEITSNQNELTNRINEVDTVTKDVSDILKSIAGFAGKTKLIGLNASIEAARLGNDGRGFAVVAKEIQTLAERSNNTVTEVNKLNEQIRDKIMLTIQDASSTLSATEDQSAAMEELSATIQNTVGLAERLEMILVK